MKLFRLIQDYIDAIRAQTAASLEATRVAERALAAAAWERYRANCTPWHHHDHGQHGGGNASVPGSYRD